MREERWEGEPLIDRLTILERTEVQAWYVRSWAAIKRRQRWILERRTSRAEQRAIAAAQRLAAQVVDPAKRPRPGQPPGGVKWKPFQGKKSPHPLGHRPYKPWDGKVRMP